MDKAVSIIGILAVLAVIVQGYNFLAVSGLSSSIEEQNTAITGLASLNLGALSAGSTASSASGSPSGTASFADVIPKGVPAVYGQELGISYSDVSASNQQLADATITKLGAFDKSITLSGDLLQRYIKTVSQISCEYCCGADSIIFPDGKAACGCAHSYAMRGLAKYLLQNHASEFSDDQILEELGKWKTLFFPGQMTQKAQIMQQQGIQLNYINLASNKYRGIEKGSAGSGMVGGC